MLSSALLLQQPGWAANDCLRPLALAARHDEAHPLDTRISTTYVRDVARSDIVWERLEETVDVVSEGMYSLIWDESTGPHFESNAPPLVFTTFSGPLALREGEAALSRSSDEIFHYIQRVITAMEEDGAYPQEVCVVRFYLSGFLRSVGLSRYGAMVLEQGVNDLRRTGNRQFNANYLTMLFIMQFEGDPAAALTTIGIIRASIAEARRALTEMNTSPPAEGTGEALQEIAEVEQVLDQRELAVRVLATTVIAFSILRQDEVTGENALELVRLCREVEACRQRNGEELIEETRVDFMAAVIVAYALGSRAGVDVTDLRDIYLRSGIGISVDGRLEIGIEEGNVAIIPGRGVIELSWQDQRIQFEPLPSPAAFFMENIAAAVDMV